MRAAIIQHVPFAGLGRIRPWLDRRGIEAVRCRPYAGDAMPDLETFDLLIALGGPLSVHDTERHLWLLEEKQLIGEALAAGKRLLGIDLGGRLLAEALGAEVHVASQAQIGWWPLEKYAQAQCSPLGRMLPQRLMALHWHREIFDLPPGAVPLYGSAACANQGFIWEERVLALQCHLESTPATIEALLKACSADLGRAGAVQDLATIRDGALHCSSQAPTLLRLLDYLSGPHAELT